MAKPSVWMSGISKAANLGGKSIDPWPDHGANSWGKLQPVGDSEKATELTSFSDRKM